MKQLKVGIAYPALEHSIYHWYPNARVIKDPTMYEVSKYDLIILTGGEDVDPSSYREPNLHSYSSRTRDSVEFTVMDCAWKLDKTILGICRGHQLISVYFGIKLVQDIRIELDERHGGSHELSFTRGSSLVKRHYTRVNSLHHQGVEYRPGPFTGELYPTSYYGKIVESCETKNGRVYTTQFHPEMMSVDSFWEELAEITIRNKYRTYGMGNTADAVNTVDTKALANLNYTTSARYRNLDSSQRYNPVRDLPTWAATMVEPVVYEEEDGEEEEYDDGESEEEFFLEEGEL